MWQGLERSLSRRRSRLRVVQKMIELGIRVGEGKKLYVGDVAISDVALARAAGTDRRVVRDAVRQIASESEFTKVFSRIRPAGPTLMDMGEESGRSVLVVTAESRFYGVITAVAGSLSRHGFTIREAHAEDPDLLPEPKLTLVVEGKIPPEVVKEIGSLALVRSATLAR